MQNFILSCDWGTSSFRLKLVDIHLHQVVAEMRSAEGIAVVYNKWKSVEQLPGSNRLHFYFGELQKHIEALSHKTFQPLTGATVIISGMASSSIGIKELPYATMPFSLSGNDAILEIIESDRKFPFSVLLVSGIRNRNDVVRGEETQMIGLSLLSPEIGKSPLVCILPGTHAKHIEIRDGKLVDFETCMTGEIFRVISRYSILKDSISGNSGDRPLQKEEVNAFQLGVVHSGETNLLNALFSVRTNDLFNLLTKKENFNYLSGLLIGSELNSLKNRDISHLVLCSEDNLSGVYKLGLQQLDLLEKTTIISAEIMDRAVTEAHIKIFENHNHY